MKKLYVGIDVGKGISWICVIGEDGQIVNLDKTHTLDERAWRALFSSFKDHELHAAFEIGAHYDWMYDLLREYCVDVQVVNPQEFAVISKSTKKTDKIDAQKLAEGLRRGDLPTVFVPEKWNRRDRRLVAHMHHLSRDIASIKIRIRNMLFTARMTCPCSNLTGVRARVWLEQTARPSLDEQDQLFLGQLLAQLDVLEPQYEALRRLAAQRMKAYTEAPLAQSVPGFGTLVTLAILSSIVQVSRFKEPDELACYFGLTGKVNQSSKKLILGPISKRGNLHVRWLLGQAVTHLIRRDAKVRQRYQKLKRKKGAKVARVAVMRWIVTILWRMLTKGEPYRLNGKAAACAKREAA